MESYVLSSVVIMIWFMTFNGLKKTSIFFQLPLIVVSRFGTLVQFEMQVIQTKKSLTI